MSQLWTIVAPDGAYQTAYTAAPELHPVDDGHAAECEGKAVYPLPRELAEGERVDYKTGEIVFDQAPRLIAALVAEIKAEAQRRCYQISSAERQLNDLRQPSADGDARFAAIDTVRAWSNDLETQLAAASSVADLAAVRAALIIEDL